MTFLRDKWLYLFGRTNNLTFLRDIFEGPTAWAFRGMSTSEMTLRVEKILCTCWLFDEYSVYSTKEILSQNTWYTRTILSITYMCGLMLNDSIQQYFDGNSFLWIWPWSIFPDTQNVNSGCVKFDMKVDKSWWQSSTIIGYVGVRVKVMWRLQALNHCFRDTQFSLYQFYWVLKLN